MKEKEAQEGDRACREKLAELQWSGKSSGANEELCEYLGERVPREGHCKCKGLRSALSMASLTSKEKGMLLAHVERRGQY